MNRQGEWKIWKRQQILAIQEKFWFVERLWKKNMIARWKVEKQRNISTNRPIKANQKKNWHCEFHLLHGYNELPTHSYIDKWHNNIPISTIFNIWQMILTVNYHTLQHQKKMPINFQRKENPNIPPVPVYNQNPIWS
jgi:hypothetical protein